MASLAHFTWKQGFYISLPVLHGVAAIASLVICFYCDVHDISHQARVPVALPIPKPLENETERLYLAGFPWAEDAEFVTHTWNPFPLIMTFQWLTAGFALRNVATLAWDGVISSIWCVWLAVGYALYATWTFTSFGGPFCVAMFSTITLCYLVSGMLCIASVGPPKLCCGPTHRRPRYSSVPSHEAGQSPPLPPPSNTHLWTSTDGRLW
jgi:hypothetical protein